MGSVKKKAIILARVSTVGQAEEELPIESQIDAGRAEAERLGAEVVKVFTEDGVSGRKDKRDVFQEAVEYCQLMDIDYFILWNTARFARHRALAAWTKFNLRKHGTELVYVSQKINTATDEGWLLEGLFELMDENYSRTVSKDTLRSMLKNARDGFFNGGVVPYGYVAIPAGKRKRLAVLEEEAAVVRMVFAACLNGDGTKRIATWLNASGIKRRGKLWTKASVNYLLCNEVYTGTIVFNRTDYSTRAARPAEEWIRTKSHPEIVSEEDFMKVQQLMAERAPEQRGSPRSQFLFTGLMRCGRCKAAMQIHTGKGQGGKIYSYYQCGSFIRGKGCSSRMIPAPFLDKLLLDVLVSRMLTRDRIEEAAREIDEMSGKWARERAKRREVIVAALRETERRRQNLFDVLEAHGRDAPNLGDLSSRIRDLNAQIRDQERALSALEEARAPASLPPAQLEEVAEFVRVTMERGSPEKVRHFLSSFVDDVVMEDRGAMIHYNPARLVSVRNPELVRSDRNWLPDQLVLRTVLPVQLPQRYWLRAA